MIQPESFFGNLFADPKITTTRLASFASDFVNNMTAGNDKDQYTALIALISEPLAAVRTELGEVASSLAFQKGSTKTNDEVLNTFIATMRSKAGVIADAFGGDDTPQYIAFYPQGIRQYTRATKTDMPTLTQQVAKAAEKYKADIGDKLADTLSLFVADWQKSRDLQEQQKGDVKDNRTDRSENRTDLEIALCQALHTIGSMYPAQTNSCLPLFTFSLLYPQTKHKSETFANAMMPPLSTDLVVNRMFTDTYEIGIHNPDDNAIIAAWLAADDKEPYTEGKGVQVLPGKTMNVKPSKLGDLKHTFLRVANLSDVNDGGYEVTIS